MRYVVARRVGWRGEGLGNEMFAWAKGAIASQVLDAKLIGPSWGLNKRMYHRNFGTSRADWIIEDILTRLPSYAFTEADYRSSGEVDFGRAVEVWAARKGLPGKSNFIVTVDGMYGGCRAIRNARPFLYSRLLGSRDTLRNMYQLSAGLDPRRLFAAVHMRSTQRGFRVLEKGESPRGRFNIVIPGDWYIQACHALRKEFGDSLQFHIFTDKGGSDYHEVVRLFNPGQQTQSGLTECSDLLVMAQADLRICSISSYSMIASFLSDGPYLWYEPQLNRDNGVYNIWGSSPDEREPESLTAQGGEFASTIEPTRDNAATFRGYSINTGDPIPEGLVVQLQRKLRLADPRTDLLRFGSVPTWAGSKFQASGSAREGMGND
jgi:hypothetical protein